MLQERSLPPEQDMHKKRTSIIWELSKEDFTLLIKNCRTIAEVLNFFGLLNKGGNYRTLKKRLQEENISIAHFQPRTIKTKGKLVLQEMLTENSPHSRHNIKKRIMKENLLEYKCAECESEPIWNNKPLVLILDHINGISNDYRIENLRFLCPNCNSQTNTFAGKNSHYHVMMVSKEFKEETPRYCQLCGNLLKRNQKCYCSIECLKLDARRVEWPSREQLEQDINSMNWCAIGRKYGVSDNAVRKWAKQYQIVF